MLFDNPDYEQLSDDPTDTYKANSNQFGLRLVIAAWCSAMVVVLSNLLG
jgi:hypothetical protein